MNSSSTEPNEAPNGVPTDSSETTTDEQIVEAEAELKASTPKTLPLKRGTAPLFVPVTLPHETEEEASPETSGSPEAASGEPALPEPSAEPVATVTEVEAVKAAPESELGLPIVEFSPPPEAIHRASVTLELRSSVTEASIRYALDAEDVGESGLLYNPAEKIFLTQSATVVAKAFLNGQGGPLAVGHFEIAKPSWQKLEPTEQVDPTTHEASDEATLEGQWHLAAASLRGRLHAHRGGWREDAFRHALAHASDGTYSVVVVSDGAGSAALSRVGSNLLCQTACDFLVSALSKTAPLPLDSKALIEHNLPTMRGLLVESASLALQKLRDEAATREKPISEFASTLLILVRREWNGQQLCASLQAGDGGIALWNDDNTLTLLGEADHGEHSSETRFLTTNGMEAELAARVKFSIRPNLRAFAVMTDGVADDYFPEVLRFPELFKEILPIVEGNQTPGAALLDWIDYEKKGSSDDRTIVVCWRVTKGGSDGNQ